MPKEECGTGPVPACPLSAYRTVDGSCNNPYKPNQWGVAMRPFRRQLPADYGDGKFASHLEYNLSKMWISMFIILTVFLTGDQ